MEDSLWRKVETSDQPGDSQRGERRAGIERVVDRHGVEAGRLQPEAALQFASEGPGRGVERVDLEIASSPANLQPGVRRMELVDGWRGVGKEAAQQVVHRPPSMKVSQAGLERDGRARQSVAVRGCRQRCRGRNAHGNRHRADVPFEFAERLYVRFGWRPDMTRHERREPIAVLGEAGDARRMGPDVCLRCFAQRLAAHEPRQPGEPVQKGRHETGAVVPLMDDQPPDRLRASNE